MKALDKHKNTYYYNAIQDYYSGKSAERSRLPYMNHIDEGIVILDILRAPYMAIEAFCLHPLFQGDEQLKKFYNNKELHALMGSRVMQLVMEYRNVANNFLPIANTLSYKEPKLSPIENVNWMLLADKIQNYKDFLKYQRHPHMGLKPTMSKEKWDNLDLYFQRWLQVLAPNFGFTFDKEIQIAWKAIDKETP